MGLYTMEMEDGILFVVLTFWSGSGLVSGKVRVLITLYN